jgi:hypothetical protein
VQPLTLYVRTDGSDVACDGTANQPASAAPDCAVASPQQALNLVPMTVQHPVTINLASGTYYALPSQPAVLYVQRTILANAGSLTISGGAAVTLSGATASSPGTPSTTNGIAIVGGWGPQFATPVVLQNVTITETAGPGIDIESGAVEISGVSTTHTGSYGMLCNNHANCTLAGTVTITGSTGGGVVCSHGSVISSLGSLAASSNGGDGVDLEKGCTGYLNTINAIGNTGTGLSVWSHSQAYLAGQLTASGNSNGVTVSDGAYLQIGGGASISTPGNSAGLGVYRNALAVLNGAAAVSVTCSGSGTAGVSITEQSTLTDDTLSGSFTISGCGTGILVQVSSSFDDNPSAGSRSLSGNTVNTQILTNSVFYHGNFPAGSCASGAQCD